MTEELHLPRKTHYLPHAGVGPFQSPFCKHVNTLCPSRVYPNWQLKPAVVKVPFDEIIKYPLAGVVKVVQ